MLFISIKIIDLAGIYIKSWGLKSPNIDSDLLVIHIARLLIQVFLHWLH